MNMMKMILAACAVAMSGLCPAEEQVAAAAKGEACPCKCACEAQRRERMKPVSLTLDKNVKEADVDAFKKAMLAKVNEMVAKVRTSEDKDDKPPVRLMLIVDDGRRPPAGAHGRGKGPQGSCGPEGCPPPGARGKGPQGSSGPEGCPPPPPAAE